MTIFTRAPVTTGLDITGREVTEGDHVATVLPDDRGQLNMVLRTVVGIWYTRDGIARASFTRDENELTYPSVPLDQVSLLPRDQEGLRP